MQPSRFAAPATFVTIVELLQLFPVDRRLHGLLAVQVRVLKVVVRGHLQFPVILREAVHGRLLAGLREGHELPYLVPLRRLQLMLREHRTGIVRRGRHQSGQHRQEHADAEGDADEDAQRRAQFHGHSGGGGGEEGGGREASGRNSDTYLQRLVCQ